MCIHVYMEHEEDKMLRVKYETWEEITVNKIKNGFESIDDILKYMSQVTFGGKKYGKSKNGRK